MAGWKTLSFTALLVFACASAGLQDKSQQSTKPTYNDSDGYLVLSALLDDQLGSRNAAIIVSPETVPESGMLSSLNCGRKPNGFEAAEKDFHERNKLSLRLVPKFSTKSRYEFYDEKKVRFSPTQAWRARTSPGHSRAYLFRVRCRIRSGKDPRNCLLRSYLRRGMRWWGVPLSCEGCERLETNPWFSCLRMDVTKSAWSS